MHAAPMTVVETPLFLRKAESLLDEDERFELVMFLGLNPGAGRYSGNRRNPQSSLGHPRERQAWRLSRDLLLSQREISSVPLDDVSQNQKANLAKAERNEWKKLIPLLVKAYAKGRKR